MSINIKGLDKAELLVSLFNASKPLGLGFFAAGHNQALSLEDAQKMISRGQTRFDYLMGRVMKIEIGNDEMEPWGYDTDNGQGAAEAVVKKLRNKEISELKVAVPTNEIEKAAEEVIFKKQ
jgi:hypothetical protein